MNALRDELGAAPRTPYTLLCPPGWRRVDPQDVVSGPGADDALAAVQRAGNPTLYVQLRAMISRYRQAMRATKVFDVYLPPALDDGVPLPASLLVSPFVLPTGIGWDAALARLAGPSRVDRAAFAQTPMWVWRRAETMTDDSGTITAKESVFLAPVPDESVHRALRFQFTALAPPTDDGDEKADQLLAIGDLMMGTMRWVERV